STELSPDFLAIAEALTQHRDWKEALDSVIQVVRSVFIYDNLALYLFEKEHEPLTIAYARAVGRGQSAEADAAWGEEIANEVMEKNSLVISESSAPGNGENRVDFPCLMGLPLRTSEGTIGALVFVRFGGPLYTPEHIQRGQFIATQISSLIDRKILVEKIKALQDAKRVIALQQEFIDTISHELRTPLGFIKGYSTTLLRKDTEWDEDTRREFLTIIDEEADRLAGLISNMLESARLQSNTLPMNFQPVRLDAVIRDTMFRSKARYNMEVTADLPPCASIVADAVRLAQVIENLFSNASKYAPGTPIEITLREEHNHLVVRFTDHGPGIPPEHQEHLFDRFYRVPTQTFSTSGSGLGLFICKKIIEAHHGDLSVESQLGKGTTFIISLPVAGK
ncbi:MAG TPA: GAF domain-containing sensor histidine kinase, partial [Pseudomonadales bacterium]|nr:GAF domain-containing sensor histidine kinase [Pseudomonadales bacterium]